MVNIKYIQFLPLLAVFLFGMYKFFFARDIGDSLCDGYKRYPKGIVKSATYYKSITRIKLLGDSIEDYAYVMGNGGAEKIDLYNYLQEGDSLTRHGDFLYIYRKGHSTIWKIYRSSIQDEWLRDCK